MRILFAGTPRPAVPSLEALVAAGHEVAAVITRPDARAGRGRVMHESDVALAAQRLSVPVIKPESLRTPEFEQWLADQAVDVVVVVAYGAMIPKRLLDAVPQGWLNLHFSLLPAWRGAAPVQHSICAGDDITGATVFRIDSGLDTGPILSVYTEPVLETDTTETLMQRLSEHGADLMCRTLDAIAEGTVVAVAQSDSGISRAPMIDVEQARIDWFAPAVVVDRTIRAFTPAPGAWTMYQGQRIKVTSGYPGRWSAGDPAPGEFSDRDGQVVVGTGAGILILTAVKPAGKGVMPAVDWCRGLRTDTDTDGRRFDDLPRQTSPVSGSSAAGAASRTDAEAEDTP